MKYLSLVQLKKIWADRNARKYIYGGVVLLLVLFLFLRRDNSLETVTENTLRSVTLSSVSDLAQNTTSLPLLGIVSSLNEGTIRAESSGKITVYKSLGDYVAAGSVIAEFDNATERASVLSASGAYDAAKAGISIAGVNSDIAAINTNTSGLSLDSAKATALNAVTSAYITLDDAVRTKTDAMFSNPKQRDAKFIVSISDAKLLINLEEEHRVIEVLLDKRALRNQTLSTSDDLVAELVAVESEANQVKQYLDDLSLALNLAIPDTSASRAIIDGFKTVAGIARASVSGTLSSIVGSRTALNGSIAGNKIAGQSFTQSTQGATAGAEANLKAAQGGLLAAEARLEKTIVRSPISGTINSLSVTTGDFVSPYSEIAIVSNNGALEVVAYATEDDAQSLRVGSKVTIEKTVPGVITRIASALDTKTKKIEVRIGILSNSNTLINGQSVRIGVTRPTTTIIEKGAVIRIPLAALKITPLGAVVFTVNASSTLIAHDVKEGALSGNQIVITEGLTPDMMIVTDARGLKDGQQISIIK